MSEMGAGSRLMKRVIGCDMAILAIDPGETSGLACLPKRGVARTRPVLCPARHAIARARTRPVSTQITVGMWTCVDTVAELLPFVDVVVIESWRLYHWAAKTRINSDMPESRLIGALEYAARLTGVPVVFQPAMITKSKPWVDAWLKETLGKLPSDHERDAVKHLVHYALKSCA